MVKVVLSEDKLSVKIGNDLTLRVGETIPFKETVGDKSSMGKITELKHPGYRQCDEESVWMCIADIMTGEADWLSCAVWKQQKDMNLFQEIQMPPAATPAETANDSDNKKKKRNGLSKHNKGDEPTTVSAVPTDLW